MNYEVEEAMDVLHHTTALHLVSCAKDREITPIMNFRTKDKITKKFY